MNILEPAHMITMWRSHVCVVKHDTNKQQWLHQRKESCGSFMLVVDSIIYYVWERNVIWCSLFWYKVVWPNSIRMYLCGTARLCVVQQGCVLCVWLCVWTSPYPTHTSPTNHSPTIYILPTTHIPHTYYTHHTHTHTPHTYLHPPQCFTCPPHNWC